MKHVIQMSTGEGNRNKTISKGFDEFILSRKAKNLSPDSIESYRSLTKGFLDFIGRDTKCSEIGKDVAINYMSYLSEEKPHLSQQSVKTYMNHMKIFLEYLMNNNDIIVFKIEIPKADEAYKEIYTPHELELILRKPDLKKCGFAHYRTWVILSLIFATGLRVKAIINIKIKDINFEEHELIVPKTKSRKVLRIGLSPEVEKMLREYLLYRKGEPEDFLFCTVNATPLTAGGLTSSTERYCHSLGVLKTSRHLLRHTFATYYLKEGDGNIENLRIIMGHSSLEMTRKYLHMASKEVVEKHIANCPLDKFKERTEEAKKERIKMTKGK